MMPLALGLLDAGPQGADLPASHSDPTAHEVS